MLISVVTVCFNDIEGLKKTFESIKSQTNKSFEFIVVDGKSTDGTHKLLERITHDGGFKNISEIDFGIYDAMNKGVNLASGKYVVFMNAGDVFANDEVIKNVSLKLKSEPAIDCLYGDSIVNYPKELVYKTANLTFDNSDKHFHYDKPYCHQSLFLKKSLLLDNPFDLGMPIIADFKSYHEISCLNECYIPYPLSCFDTGGVSDIKRMSVHLAKFKYMTGKYGFKVNILRHYCVCIMVEVFKSLLRGRYR